ncbi:MAG TPA: DUF4112 domain-containing protein [Silvibacterium sp.]|nr:DUF4112 domain-containing protein [Silvibacterium sp.]
MNPEILPPGQEPSVSRTRVGRSVFTDENLDVLSRVLDECFRIPGTQIRFGIDGLIGLVPFVGDILAGLASCIIVIAAWFRGAPYVTLARMIVNLGLEVLVGTIPFFGDAFGIAWKANRRNYKLLTRHLRQPHKHTWKDYIFFLCVAMLLLAIFAIPVLIVLWLTTWLLGHA